MPTIAAGRSPKPERFGDYVLYECLGTGGMATVHRAKKRGIAGFERAVAIKRLLPHLSSDNKFVASFVREARLASLLQHANVVQIYDLGRLKGIYYIAMEHVPGVDVHQILRQARNQAGIAPVAITLALMSELLDGLDYAHDLADAHGRPLNIVHRDVSPSNAIVARDGHLKLIDFGIAKATEPSLKTRSGLVKGKFGYMSPEALRAQELDRRSDVFSAGIVLWELLTARPLFTGRTDVDTVRRLQELEVPAPSTRNPACPPDLDAVVLKALARNRDDRWASAAAMHRALGRVEERYSLRATNREVARWIRWAFAQTSQPKRTPWRPLTPPKGRVLRRLNNRVGHPNAIRCDPVMHPKGPPPPAPRASAAQPPRRSPPPVPQAAKRRPRGTPPPPRAFIDDHEEPSIEIIWGDDEAPMAKGTPSESL